jgi:hypothetical protein
VFSHRALPPALQVGVLARKDQYGEDLNGVMEMIVYGLKGMCAYGDHAAQVWRVTGRACTVAVEIKHAAWTCVFLRGVEC